MQLVHALHLPDSQNVAVWNTVVFQFAYKALNNIIEARTEASTCHNGTADGGGVMIDSFSCPCSDGPGRKRYTDLKSTCKTNSMGCG